MKVQNADAAVTINMHIEGNDIPDDAIQSLSDLLFAWFEGQGLNTGTIDVSYKEERAALSM